MIYNQNTFTWGYELEFGDVDRRLQIPAQLGEWEYAETDIVNVLPPYQYIACDPLGLEPPYGGEINVKPATSKHRLIDRIDDIISFFEQHGNQPTPSCVSHGHVHVYVPGLREDLPALKRLISYIKLNQHRAVERIHAFVDKPGMKEIPGAKAYLKLDCGRLMPDFMCDNIINLATNFDQFIRLHAAGKDGVSMGRPFRYAINTYCMKHTGTVEFRFFRNSVDLGEMLDELLFVEEFMLCALNGESSTVDDLLDAHNYQFPPFIFDAAAVKGWVITKYSKERGHKERKYYDAS